MYSSKQLRIRDCWQLNKGQEKSVCGLEGRAFDYTKQENVHRSCIPPIMNGGLRTKWRCFSSRFWSPITRKLFQQFDFQIRDFYCTSFISAWIAITATITKRQCVSTFSVYLIERE